MVGYSMQRPQEKDFVGDKLVPPSRPLQLVFTGYSASRTGTTRTASPTSAPRLPRPGRDYRLFFEGTSLPSVIW
jgi:hypothetical protein